MNNVIWNTLEEAQSTNDRGALISMALTSWAHCMAGNEPPEYFGEMMVEIGRKLGIANTPDNISKLADEFILSNNL